MPVPVPSCKYRHSGVPSSCCLIAVQRADVAASQPGILLPTVSCGTCCVAVSLLSGLSFLCPLLGLCPNLCFETLDPSLHLIEKCTHEGFLYHPATRLVEWNFFYSDHLLRFATFLTETVLAVLWDCLWRMDLLTWTKEQQQNGGGGAANCFLRLKPFSYPSVLKNNHC